MIGIESGFHEISLCRTAQARPPEIQTITARLMGDPRPDRGARAEALRLKLGAPTGERPIARGK